jgi:hypothetical protein
MQVGTEILLARMKEYPDEFYGSYGSRWGAIVDDARQYLPKEDVEALDEGYRQMQVDRFNERVLARLAGEEKEETLTYKASERYSAGVTDPRVQYEQALKKVQSDIDTRRRAMQAQNNAMNSLYTGANGVSIGDWLTGDSNGTTAPNMFGVGISGSSS